VKVNEKRLTFSVEEAGYILGLSRQTAYTAVVQGYIPSIKIGRRVLIPRAEFFRRFPELVLDQQRRSETETSTPVA
jgi:excisionase family DNA binding protein